MTSSMWLVLGVLIALPTTTGCVSRGKYGETVDELYKVQSENKRLRELSEDYGNQLSSTRERATALEGENSQLRANWEQASRQIADLERQLKEQPALNIEGVSTISTPEGLILRIEDRVLFDSGRSELKGSGKSTIGKVADLLKSNDLKLEIAGHTDNDPVQKTKKLYPRGNMELGADRALSVFDAMRGAGIPEGRMHVSSYGEFDPVDAGDKAKNRRVEIRVLRGAQ